MLMAAEGTAWHHRAGVRLLAEVFGDLSLCVLPNLNPGTALSPGQLGLSDPYRPGVPAGGRRLERRWVNLLRALKEVHSSQGKRTFWHLPLFSSGSGSGNELSEAGGI